MVGNVRSSLEIFRKRLKKRLIGFGTNVQQTSLNDHQCLKKQGKTSENCQKIFCYLSMFLWHAVCFLIYCDMEDVYNKTFY